MSRPRTIKATEGCGVAPFSPAEQATATRIIMALRCVPEEKRQKMTDALLLLTDEVAQKHRRPPALHLITGAGVSEAN
jgi:hypothetical protein